MRKLRKGDCYALLRSVNPKQFKDPSSRRDDKNKSHQAVKSLQFRPLCIILFALSYMLFSEAQAQSAGERTVADGLSEANPVQIGLRIPETFWTKEHLFFINGDTVRKTLEEHKGKMVVLDFWFSGCTPCLNHQRDIKSFSEQYKDDLVVVMVNSKKTRETYQKIRTLYDKDFFLRFGIGHVETIIEDDFLDQLFPYSSYPHYVWINKAERLQLRTFRNLLDRNYVAPFIDRL